MHNALAPAYDQSLFCHLKGRFLPASALKDHTWFGVGGPSWGIFYPRDLADLMDFLKLYEGPFFVLGAGSNLLVHDQGVEGIVLKLSDAFTFCDPHPEGGPRLSVGAGVFDRTVAQEACRLGISGVEFLYTIPGSLGGALAGNAGCYGTEIVDIVESVDVVTPQGDLHRLTVEDMGYEYRSSKLPKGWICVSAVLKGTMGEQAHIRACMKDFAQRRKETQPLQVRTGGSTFKNPAGHSAWQLIENVEGRGLTVGGAQFSEKHPNFLLNLGGATAQDLWCLGEEVRQRVHRHNGVLLEWEIHRWGFKDVPL